MAQALEIFNAWQSRQQAGDFDHLGEVVDLEGFRDICIGLSDWTTGYQAAFANLTRNILTPFADLHMTVESSSRGRMQWRFASTSRRSMWETSLAFLQLDAVSPGKR